MKHSERRQGDYEWRTVRITAGQHAGWGHLARRRNRELETIEADGWEIVTIAPRRFGTGKDEVTCRRPRGYRPPQPTRAPSWWEQAAEDLLTPAWMRRLRRRLRG